jgi:hypothetical protein
MSNQIAQHKKPLHSQMHWYVSFSGSVIGLLLLLLFWWMENTAARGFFLFLGGAATLNSLLRLVAAFVFPLPEGHCKRFSGAVGMILAAIFLLLHVQSVAVLALAWLLLAYGLLSSYSALQKILLDALTISMLRRCYELRIPPVLHRKETLVPLVYVFTEPGFGVVYGNRLSAKIMFSLVKHRRQRAVYFLVSESLRRYPEDFCRWVAAQAAALLVVRLPQGFADESFEKKLRNYCRHALGKIFVITLNPRGETPSAHAGEFDEVALSASLLSITPGSITQQEVIAAIADEMAMSTFPVADADARLSAELYALIPAIAQKGLPPFADCYLRYRLAQSNVERFLCLLDCIEILVKCSAIVLLTSRWREGQEEGLTEIPQKLSRPSLGHWIEVLRTLLASAPEDELQQTLQAFWRQKPSETALSMINEVNDSGLIWKGAQPRSYLAWLDWFVWLRNTTRGHGVVEEDFVTGLCHSLHETNLQMASGLDALVLSSSLIYATAGGETRYEMRGWRRAIAPAIDNVEQSINPAVPYVYLNHNADASAPLLLYPFVTNQEGSTLLWNSVREKTVEYLNYGSGQSLKIPSLETDPYSLWKRAA